MVTNPGISKFYQPQKLFKDGTDSDASSDYMTDKPSESVTISPEKVLTG